MSADFTRQLFLPKSRPLGVAPPLASLVPTPKSTNSLRAKNYRSTCLGSLVPREVRHLKIARAGNHEHAPLPSSAAGYRSRGCKGTRFGETCQPVREIVPASEATDHRRGGRILRSTRRRVDAADRRWLRQPDAAAAESHTCRDAKAPIQTLRNSACPRSAPGAGYAGQAPLSPWWSRPLRRRRGPHRPGTHVGIHQACP
jgi:hypothetical protein